MPNIGSIGWVNIRGATQLTVTHNASTIDSDQTIPAEHNSLLIGPVTVDDGIIFTIGSGAQVKIKDFDDV